ncbi:MAG: glutamate racemase [Clostridia bacterium]|nr:glutamate racemase [Clostridia bacterium]
MSDNRAIGVFDSGLGGLTVAREIMKLLPRENIVYFGDTGRVPYGTKGRDTIRKYSLQDERFLLSHDVKMIVAACGTVSSVAADTAEQLPVPFIEVVSHSVRAAVSTTKNGKIGILATSATINSGAHKKQILQLLPTAKVVEASGTLLVPIVEEGWTDIDDAVAIETLKRYLKPMMDEGVDTLILGCTHFPVLSSIIRKVLGNSVTLINMGEATAKAIGEILKQTDSLNDGTTATNHKFYASDKTDAFVGTVNILLGDYNKDFGIEQVDIEKV